MRQRLLVLCSICVFFVSPTWKCCAQEHLANADLISSFLSVELQGVISAVGKRDFKAAETILETIRSANREPRVHLDFANAVISFETKEYRTAITQCFSILEQAPTAVQVSDLMCLAAGTADMPFVMQIEALQKSVKCHQDCSLIEPFPVGMKPSDEGLRLANELLLARPQLKVDNDEANAKIKELLAVLLSEGENKITKRLAFESEPLPNKTHHYYTPDGDHSVFYLRPSKVEEYDEVLLFEAIYELLNIANKPQFLSLQIEAVNRAVTEDEFCIKNAKLEFFTILKTRQFYAARVLPILIQHGVRTDPANWALSSPGRFNAYMTRFRDDDWYPWKYFRIFYNRNSKFGYWSIEPRLPDQNVNFDTELEKPPK